MKKIIFVGGMLSGKRDMAIIKRMLGDFEVIYFPYDTSLRESIETSALKLKKFVNKLKLKKNEKVGIVSVSAGGIVSEYYLKFLDSKKVDKIVTVCSPFNGTWLPLTYSKKRIGLQEFRKNSDLLKKIKRKTLKRTIKEKNFWCWLDPLVPGTSGRGDHPEHTFFFLHWIIQFWPPLIYKIREFLLD